MHQMSNSKYRTLKSYFGCTHVLKAKWESMGEKWNIEQWDCDDPFPDSAYTSHKEIRCTLMEQLQK